MTYRYLSHLLTDEIPTYRAKARLGMRKVKAISRGDSANVSSFSMEGHWGTHVESSNHFFDHGIKLAEHPPSCWFFRSPQALRISLAPSEILECGAWLKKIQHESDLLLLQSEWCKIRDQERYIFESPGIHPSVGLYLRDRFPGLRAIGIDWMSLSSYNDRQLGRDAHRAFLDPSGKNNPLLIIEDMDLSTDMTGLEEVAAFPLRLQNTDSAPCTVIGRFYD
ncbi:MAG: cyclase family protein [Candidatus Omnitrophica bacterium]|nr:cyclase family protein [Candidatus Omnitrophota bacterium]